jgi:sugar transferase EpsL
MKRLFDLLMAATLLLVLSPLLLAIAVAVRLQMGAPILFRQQRPGLHGVSFELLKFRTMSDAVGADGRPRSDEERVSALGRVLRRYSLDELPELVNVLRGEMSLVGPRPLLVQYLARYSASQRRRHDVRPGLTGWAQVNGRNAVSWDEKLRLDVWYVDHQSVWLDMKILAMTPWKVLAHEGIVPPGRAAMTEFMGSESDQPTAGEQARDA